MIFKFSFVASAILALATAAPALATSDGESSTKTARAAYAAQLGPNAREKYREIFAAIRAGEWSDAASKLDAMSEGPDQRRFNQRCSLTIPLADWDN